MWLPATLRDRSFRQYFVGQTLSTFGDSLVPLTTPAHDSGGVGVDVPRWRENSLRHAENTLAELYEHCLTNAPHFDRLPPEALDAVRFPGRERVHPQGVGRARRWAERTARDGVEHPRATAALIF